MAGLPSAFALALRQFTDPAVLKVWAKSMALTLLVFVALGAGLAWLLPDLAAPLTGGGEAMDGALAALGVVLAMLAGWFLFRLVAIAVLQLFADEVVQAVELRHYPRAAAAAKDLPMRRQVRIAVKGMGRTLGINALALPFAIALTVAAPFIFWAANAWLLGRELTDMVWLRHAEHDDARPPLGPLGRFALGGVVAALLIVPFANLLAPLLGAAAAAHLIHRRTGGIHAA